MTVSVDNCVAPIESCDLAGATTACDAVVSAARRARWQSSLATFVSGGERSQLALAYSGRAVLHYLSGRLSVAEADARRAMSVFHLAETKRTSAVIRAAANDVAKAGD